MSKEKKNNNEAVYMPASILVASIIISATLFVTAGNINNGFTDLSTAIQGVSLEAPSGNSGSGTAVAAPQPESSPQPSGTINITALLEGAAGKEGSDDAEIMIIEYSDYQCPFCRSWFSQSKSQLDKEYIETEKVQFVYKDFPLSNLHPMAQPYAEAARCAGDQGKYWEMHNKIFDEQNKFGQGTVSQITIETVKSWSGELGLDSGELNSCIDSGKYGGQVQTNLSEGQQIGVSGTPSFVIGKRNGTGQLIVGAQPYGVFKGAIDSLLG